MKLVNRHETSLAGPQKSSRLLDALPRAFFEPSAAVVAPALLGSWLVRNTLDGPCGGPIIEAEAYLTADPACHAYNGETTRNRTMWGPPGRAYVYFIYGNHFCVNAVCRPSGIGEAVLIRAIEPCLNPDSMLARRPVKARALLTNGPGKLCQALAIDRTLDGADLCDPASPLYIARNPDLERFLGKAGPVVATPRVGITKAAELPLRFYLAGSAFVSRG
jgi:DNA-3-methyladenine glycosylase